MVSYLLSYIYIYIYITYINVVVCTQLSGKELHRQVHGGVERVVASGSLVSVMVSSEVVCTDL